MGPRHVDYQFLSKKIDYNQFGFSSIITQIKSHTKTILGQPWVTDSLELSRSQMHFFLEIWLSYFGAKTDGSQLKMY